MIGLVLRYVLPLVGGIGVILAMWAWVTTGAYNRGKAAAHAESEAYIQRMESALTEALKRNEALPDDVIDCRLRRLRNPGAACP